MVAGGNTGWSAGTSAVNPSSSSSPPPPPPPPPVITPGLWLTSPHTLQSPCLCVVVGWWADGVSKRRTWRFSPCRAGTSTPATPPTSSPLCWTGAADVAEIAGTSRVWSTGWWRYHQPPVRCPTVQTPVITQTKVRLPATIYSCLYCTTGLTLFFLHLKTGDNLTMCRAYYSWRLSGFCLPHHHAHWGSRGVWSRQLSAELQQRIKKYLLSPRHCQTWQTPAICQADRRRLAAQVQGELDRGAGGGGRAHGEVPREQGATLCAHPDENGKAAVSD